MNDARADPLSEEFLARLEYLHVVARRLVSGRERGERRARRPGSGIEFADHRDYARGDDPRYLDWNAYGRLGRLLVRLFEEEQELAVHLIVDTSASMGRGAKFDRARQVAAALGYIALANLDRLAVVTIADGALGGALPPGRGRGRIARLLDFLRALRPSGTTDLRGGCEAFARRMAGQQAHGARGVAIVISDFYDLDYARALDLLRYHRFEPQAIQIVDAVDARPELAGEIEIVDCEGGGATELTVTPRLLAAYRREHEALCAGLDRYCAARGIASVRADTEVPFDELVLRVLRERGAVG
jgi:uncharacterized protein (DUF58 family)